MSTIDLDTSRAAAPTGEDTIFEARARRARLEVDLAAVRHNFTRLTEISRPARVMAVVKGNAYGMGAIPVTRALREAGASAFAVDSVSEGLELRSAGVVEPILVIDGDVADNAALAIAHGLTPGIPHEELLESYQAEARRQSRRVKVWLVANLGFNRSGHRDPREFGRFVKRASRCSYLEVEAVYGHLSNSHCDDQVTGSQIQEYSRALKLARRLLRREVGSSLLASHGALRCATELATDWVRPGVLLYGEHAFPDSLLAGQAGRALEGFRPALRLRARILQILEFASEQGVGYGQRHRARPGQRLATIAIGFGGGYPVTGQPHALVEGSRAPIFGDVGMDALQLDVTQIPEARRGGWATLIGRSGEASISARELAAAAGLSTYQLLRRLDCARLHFDSEKAAADSIQHQLEEHAT